MTLIEVLQPGLATSVRRVAWGRGALGRRHLGASDGGPADPFSAVRANRLVHNPQRAALLEWTLRGPTLRLLDDGIIAVCGAHFPLRLDGRACAMDAPLAVYRGQVLEVGVCTRGLRGVLAARGGINPMYDGIIVERRTVLEGEGLAALPLVGSPPPATPIEDGAVTVSLRVTPGVEAVWLGLAAQSAFFNATWTVAPASDRRGVRLVGANVFQAGASGTPMELGRGETSQDVGSSVFHARTVEMVTRGVTAGAVQIPPSGEPVVLGVDQQTTGGYPCIAHVVTVDLGRLGQLRPGQKVRFRAIDHAEAKGLLMAWRQQMSVDEGEASTSA